jgi:hypothetical protein
MAYRGRVPGTITAALVMVLMLLSDSRANQTTRPATRPARSEGADLARAIDMLAREYEAVLKDPEQPVRVECDYFRQNPSGSVTAAGVLAVLERQTSSGDLRVASYVKWQLLSGVDGKFDGPLAARAVAVYRGLPPLMVRPGTTTRDRKELDLAARGRSHDQQEAIEYKLLEQVGRFNAQNASLLRLRDELYAKLPVNYAAIAAGFDDAAERLAAGLADADFAPFVRRLVEDTRAWTVSGAPSPRELQSIHRTVSRLAVTRGPTSYSHLKWRPSENRLAWIEQSFTLNEKGILDDLAKELTDRLRGI